MNNTGSARHHGPEDVVTSEAAVPAHRERISEDQPRIYVASLSDYNSGRLHGSWIDASRNPEEIFEDIATMLAASREPTAEEWAIHDHEGFGPVRLDEYENLAVVSQIARGIADHGPAFAHWAALCGTSGHEELARFEDVYLGHWDSIEEYAEQYLDDLGIHDLIERVVPDYFQPYVTVDVGGFARDLQYSGELNVSQGDDGVYLFDQTR